MITICPVCKKEYEVLYPDKCAYKRRRTGEHQYYMCSWKCLTEFDKRKEKPDLKRAKITLEQKKRAVEIAMNGGNPLKYLADCGSDNPTGMWYTIKQDLKKADPRTYELLPKRITAGEAEKNQAAVPGIPIGNIEMPAAKDEPKTLNGSAWEPFDPEKKNQPKAAAKPVPFPEVPEKVTGIPVITALPVCAVRSRVDGGMKYKVDKDGLMVLTYEGGFFRFSLDEWKAFSEEICTALDQLGVAQ